MQVVGIFIALILFGFGYQIYAQPEWGSVTGGVVVMALGAILFAGSIWSLVTQRSRDAKRRATLYGKPSPREKQEQQRRDRGF